MCLQGDISGYRAVQQCTAFCHHHTLPWMQSRHDGNAWEALCWLHGSEGRCVRNATWYHRPMLSYLIRMNDCVLATTGSGGRAVVRVEPWPLRHVL